MVCLFLSPGICFVIRCYQYKWPESFDGERKARPLICHRFPLDQINEAFEYDAGDEKTHSVFVALMI